jgi:hexosaminidase
VSEQLGTVTPHFFPFDGEHYLNTIEQSVPFASSFTLITNSAFELPADKTVEFELISDDGSLLFVDKQLAIDNWGEHAPQLRRNTLALKQGRHRVMTVFFNGCCTAYYRLRWRIVGRQPWAIYR